jgi:hypothetical protein
MSCWKPMEITELVSAWGGAFLVNYEHFVVLNHPVLEKLMAFLDLLALVEDLDVGIEGVP